MDRFLFSNVYCRHFRKEKEEESVKERDCFRESAFRRDTLSSDRYREREREREREIREREE